MKRWYRKYEWMSLAACAGSELHTAESRIHSYPDRPPPFEDWDDTPGILGDIHAAREICDGCTVRPECIEWALRENACGVMVAGVQLPDPVYKKELAEAYCQLKDTLSDERERRAD